MSMPLLGVLLFGAENQPLEVGDLPAVDVGDAAGAVGRVLVLGVDRDLGVPVGPAGGSGGADARSSPADDHDALGHQGLLRRGETPRRRSAWGTRRALSSGDGPAA